MKTTLKNTFKILGCVAGTVLLFSCSNPAGGSSSPSDTGLGVTFPTTYTVPTLPEGSGDDPFAGNTYRHIESTSDPDEYTDYTFGTNGSMTITSAPSDDSTDFFHGYKYEYTYINNANELNLRASHCCIKVNNEYKYFTYAETINYFVHLTKAQLCVLSGAPASAAASITNAQAKMLVEYMCTMVKSEFENATTSKAVLNSGDMELRQAYYKAVPTLPDNKDYRFEYTHTFDNGTRAIFSLNFYAINSFEGMGYLFNPMGPVTQFNITDITSTTITAQEADNNTLTTLPNGKKWLMDYTIALGADNNLVITLTGSDNSTKIYFRNMLFASENNPTITYSTDTRPSLYTLVR